jgi:hypothetical protein
MPTSELARDHRADDDRVRLESRVLLDFASMSSRVAALLPLPQGMEAYSPRPVFGTTSAHWRPPIVRRPQEPTTSTPDLEGVQWYDPRTTHAESTQPSPCLQRPRSARMSRRRVILAALRRARHRRSNLGRTETCGPHGAKKAEGRRCRPLRTVYGIGPQVSSSCHRPFQAPRCAPISVAFPRFRQRRRCAPTCVQGTLGAGKPAAQHRCAGEPIRAACTRRRRLMRDPYAPLPLLRSHVLD